MPPEIWTLTHRFREVVLEAVAAARVSHTFTNCLAHLPGEAGALNQFAALARQRGAQSVPADLTCRGTAAAHGSRARLKLNEPAALQATLGKHGILPLTLP